MCSVTLLSYHFFTISEDTCANFYSKDKCEASCGLGALIGKCNWRSGVNESMTKNYSTCVPHRDTCPDGVCDELETRNPLICPQDCTTSRLFVFY